MIVIKTSIFPASKDEVFNKLQKLKLLQYIAWPYATFTPVGERSLLGGPEQVLLISSNFLVSYLSELIRKMSSSLTRMMEYILMKETNMFRHGITGLY